MTIPILHDLPPPPQASPDDRRFFRAFLSGTRAAERAARAALTARQPDSEGCRVRFPRPLTSEEMHHAE